MNEIEKSGYIAIIGRPNVGKSTLLNFLLGKKISITSPKPQTTRHQILGIKTIGTIQAVYVDTPGMNQAHKSAMNRYLNRVAGSVIFDADVLVFMVEANRWHDEDELVLSKLQHATCPVYLVINKVDTVNDKRLLLPFIDKIKDKFSFADIFPISAKIGLNMDVLEEKLMQLLPVGPHLFPDTQITDKTERFQVAEFIREQVIRATEQELPYSTTVEIEAYIVGEKMIEIGAIIWVEREGQKAIVIGAKGAMLKKIGTLARKALEKHLEKKVFLRLWVKVKERWTENERALQSLGYD